MQRPAAITEAPWPQVEMRFPAHPFEGENRKEFWKWVRENVNAQAEQRGFRTVRFLFYFSECDGGFRPAMPWIGREIETLDAAGDETPEAAASPETYPRNLEATPVYSTYDTEGNPVGAPDYWFIRCHVHPGVYRLFTDPPRAVPDRVKQIANATTVIDL